MKRKRSSESVFIRTGKIMRGFDLKRAEKIGAMHLARKWGEETKARAGKQWFFKLPLPSLKQRRFGARLSETEKAEIRKQVSFCIDKFAGILRPNVRAELQKLILSRTPMRSQTVADNLRSYVKPTDKKLAEITRSMRGGGLNLYHTYIKKKGHIGGGVLVERKGTLHMAKGFMANPYYRVSPFHETIHALQQLGIIKIDVPFAEAADTFYALQNGFLQPNPRIKKVSTEDFDRRPRITGNPRIISGEKIFDYKEPEWAYSLGQNMGHFDLSGIAEKLAINSPSKDSKRQG